MARYDIRNDETKDIQIKLIEKQLELVGSSWTIDDLKNITRWYDKYELNLEQYNEMHDYFVSLVKKFRWNKRAIEKEFSWFMLGYGFAYKEEVYDALKNKEK